MGQELELIVELLREMERVNDTNSRNFDNLLDGINSKVDIMGRNTASAEFLRACLEELAKNLEDKYATTQSRFTEIEKALKAVFNAQDEHVKNKDIKELFDVFTTNLNNFYSESRQQRAILSSIETRLADISSDKSDKEDILRTITLLRNDFENLNHSYKSAIDSVNTNLKALLSNMIKLDQSEITNKMSDQMEVVHKITIEIVDYLKSIDKRDENLEKILANVATNESLKMTQGFIDSIIKQSEEISEKITTLADKKDIKELEKAASYMNSRFDDVVTKELFSKISTTTESLINQTDEIKQSLAGVTKNIDAQPDTRMFEDALQNLFKKFKALSKDINKLNYGENLSEIDTRLSAITSELSIIKNIASDINDAVTSKVLSAIEDISFENQSYDIKNHISKMLSELPQKEDIDRILENDIINKSAVETLIEKTDQIADRLDYLPTHQDMASLNNNQLSLVENLQEVANKSDIERLEEKADEIEEMIDKLNFDDEFENLYDKTSSIENWLAKSRLKENSEEILSQIPEKANQKDILKILTTSNKIATDLEELSQNTDAKKVNRTVSELYSMIEDLKNDFIHTTEMHNDTIIVALSELQKSASQVVTVEDFDNFIEDLKAFTIGNIEHNEKFLEALSSITQQTSTLDSSISEIKELLMAEQAKIEDFNNVNNQTLSNIENYISELKIALSGIGLPASSEDNISKIEDQLKEQCLANHEYLQAISAKLETLTVIAECSNTKTIESSFEELKELKGQIQQLKGMFGSSVQFSDTNSDNISGFLANKLEEISCDLSNLSSEFENKINSGFTYNAELLEEKTSLLLDLIKELRHSNSNNIGMYEKLTVADNKLIDFKQELELVNTDILNNINSNTEALVKEITPMREMISNLFSNTVREGFSNISDEVKTVQEAVSVNISEQDTLDKINEIYTKISNEITANEMSLRDFILSDTDSILIKLDTLKEDLEDSLTSILPPDVSEMAEFKKFAKEINSFRENQEKLFGELSDKISTTITEQFAIQNEELKSILTISENNSEILDAIEELKISIQNKLNNTSSDDDFGINQYEKEFENSKIEEIKQDFEKFATLIENLSDKNPEIEEVLQALNFKLDNIYDTNESSSEDIEIIDESNIIGADENISETNFDIIKALELLQKDISTLHDKVNNSQPINKNWLEEVKSYIAGDDIRTMLTEINSKIDVLSMSDNTDWIEDIREALMNLDQADFGKIVESNTQVQSMLDTINEKLDIISSNDNTADLEDIKFSLDAIESKLSLQEDATSQNQLTDSDAKITSMLELLNYKIDILADFDDSETQLAIEDVKALILEQRDSLSQLDNNSKTNAFKKCLDELTEEVNNINSNNSLEIQKSLKEMKESIMAAVVTIFEQVSFIEETEEIKDFVEEKTDEINKNLFEVTEQLKQIANTDNDYTYSMQDIESDLAKLRIALNDLQTSEQDSKKEQFNSILDNINRIETSVGEFSDLKTKLNELAETSGESYNTIGKLLTDNLSTKVDRVTKLIERSNDSDKVMRQALIYIGEWIDSASLSMNKISSNSDEIVDVKSALESLKSSIPAHTNILNSIEEKFDEQQERLAYFEKQITKLGNIEDRFEQQQERIDRLEMALNKILSAVEDIDDSKVTRKIDKLDKQLAKLSTNIEKIASYVD